MSDSLMCPQSGDDPPGVNKQLNPLLRDSEVIPDYATDFLRVRKETNDRDDRSPLCAVTIVDSDINPLTWCQQHPEKPADVQLTVADFEQPGAVRVFDGTLVMRPSETEMPVPASRTNDSAGPYSRAKIGSEDHSLTLRGDSGPSDLDDVEILAPDEICEDAADTFEEEAFTLPEELVFELTLPELPSSSKLSRAAVHQVPMTAEPIVTGAAHWPYLMKLNRLRSGLHAAKPQNPTGLVADNHDPTKPFLVATDDSAGIKVELFDDARLNVTVSRSMDLMNKLLIAEVLVAGQRGPMKSCYVLRPGGQVAGEQSLKLSCTVNTPDDTVDSLVTVTIRSLVSADVCLLNQEQRHAVFAKPPISCLTVRGISNETCTLSVFDDELVDVAKTNHAVLLFRLIEQEGGVQ